MKQQEKWWEYRLHGQSLNSKLYLPVYCGIFWEDLKHYNLDYGTSDVASYRQVEGINA